MAGLGQNRVYDISQIETLKSTATRLLDTGIESCMTWDRVVSELKSLQGQTPIKSSQLSGALDKISKKMYQSEYETDKCWVEGALNNVIANIPQHDVAGASLLELLNENFQYVMTMIEDLTGCIEMAGTNLNLAEFEERVEHIKRDWEGIDLDNNMEKFETLLLGIPANVTFSTDLCGGVVGSTMATMVGIRWKEILNSKEVLINNKWEEEELEPEQYTLECYAIPGEDTKRLTEEQQQANAEYIYNYLFEEGWTREAICGLLGNMQEESQMNPGVWQAQDNERMGYGLVQWTAASDKFFLWMEDYRGYEMGCGEGQYKKGVEMVNELAEVEPKTLVDLQLEYLVWSSQKNTTGDHKQWYGTLEYDSPYRMTYEEYICSTVAPEELALVFHGSYERSGDSPNERKERGVRAKEWYKYFSEEY